MFCFHESKKIQESAGAANCCQGCQMENSIKSQTVPKTGKTKTKPMFEDQKKAKLCLWYCISFVAKKHLNYKDTIKNFLRN